MKSAAIVNFAPEKYSVEIREFEQPSIGPDDVLVEVANVGVCGSDLHQWTADHSWPVNYPVVLGHEFSGNIAQLGASVNSWKEGDRVVSETAAIIDQCNPMSRRGLYNLDPTRKGFGYGVNGAMTRYVCVPSRILHSIPESLSFEHACLTEPCCVAYNAVVKNTRITSRCHHARQRSLPRRRHARRLAPRGRRCLGLRQTPATWRNWPGPQ